MDDSGTENYVPMSAYHNLPSPHSSMPISVDPWFGWAIAALPGIPLVALVVVIATRGSISAVAAPVAVALILAASYLLARRDRRALELLEYRRPPAERLGLLPVAYLYLRGSRIAEQLRSSRANWPLVIHVVLVVLLGFVAANGGAMIVLLGMQDDYYGP